LTRLPLSRIKIVRSFVRKITERAEDAAIVRSLIAMAHNVGLVVIAEGVETEAQAAFLINERCEEAQGFLYALPQPASEFEEYSRRDSRRKRTASRIRIAQSCRRPDLVWTRTAVPSMFSTSAENGS